MLFPPKLEALLAALRHLPGVGPRTAQRMALHILERDRDGGQDLARSLGAALDGIKHCQRCRMFAEEDLCPVCSGRNRDAGLLCVVETPADLVAIEESAVYRGQYFVLMGRLAPLDGIGPDEIGGPLLEARLNEGGIREMIVATGATVEGEATAVWLAALARDRGIHASRIAHGVPVGGDLEYVDSGTLSAALSARTAMGPD